MSAPLRVLMVTSAWPSPGQPRTTHFIKRQADFLQAAGVELDVFHFRAARNPLNYAAAWRELQQRISRGRYDVLHAQFGQSGLLAIPKRLPLVVTFRGSDLLGIVGRGGRYTLAGRLLQRLSRWVARRADAVIVVSPHMQAFLPPDVRAHVVPSGLDLRSFRLIPRDEARRHLGLPLAQRLVLFAANPEWPRKRYALAQQAMALVTTPQGTELVVPWGAPYSDMPYYMNACDVLLFTSMQEGSPNVVKEALACNLPVVSVAVGDVPARLAGVRGCEVTADERPETIARALERVLARADRVAGREAVADLDEARLAQRVIAIYQSLRRPARIGARVREASHVG